MANETEISISQNIDWQVLAELDELDSKDSTGLSTSYEIYMSFRGSMASRMLALEAAIQNRDLHEIERVSHVVKSSAACIGALAVQNVCDKMRLACIASNFVELDRLLVELGASLQLVINILEAHFARPR